MISIDPTIFDPRIEFAFTKVFSDETNSDALVSFLNSMLTLHEKDAIKQSELLPRSKKNEILFKKRNVIDVLCTNCRGEKYLVEMQISSYKRSKETIREYVNDAYQQLEIKGIKSSQITKTVFLAFINFIVFPEKYGAPQSLDSKSGGIRYKFFKNTLVA